MNESKPPHIVVLAGGAGSRTLDGGAKALLPVFFRPMIDYALDAAARLPRRSLIVVSTGDDAALRDCRLSRRDIRFVAQARPSGTADALRAAAPLLGEGGDVLVLSAGAVLLTAESLGGLAAAHAASQAACTEARAEGTPGAAARCFRVTDLLEVLGRADLRGLEEAARALGAGEYRVGDPREALEADDFYGLCRVEAVLRRRHNDSLARRGVDLREPATTLIDPRCRIEAGVRIDGCCTVVDSVLERGARLETLCRVVGSAIGPGSRLRRGTYAERALVGRGCSAGPYARLRPGTRLRDGAGLGTFAELRAEGGAPISGRA